MAYYDNKALLRHFDIVKTQELMSQRYYIVSFQMIVEKYVNKYKYI